MRRAATGGRLVILWAVSSLLLFALMALWGLATPLGAAPDEPTQIVKAAAVVRGEWLGTPTPGQQRAVRTVTVPATFAEVAAIPGCYAAKSTVPAGCAPALVSSGRTVRTTTYVGRYPPLYYALVGLPTLASPSVSSIRAMRLVGSLLSALLWGLALATAATWSRSRLLVAAAGLALTPLAVFLGSVVNPSGLEIAAGASVWVAGLLLVLDHADDPPGGLLAVFVAGGCLLELMRGLSPLWMALIGVTLVALDPRRCWRLLCRRSVQLALGVVGVVGVLASAYIVGAGTLSVATSGRPLATGMPVTHVALTFVDTLPAYWDQVVGDFGALDTPSPTFVYVLVGAALVGLVGVATATARRRHLVVLVGLMAAALVVTAAIVVPHAARTHSLIWQARDGFPLYMGIPLLAGAVAGRGRRLETVAVRVMAAVAAVVVLVSQFVDFAWALRRNTIGTVAGLDLFRRVPGGWTPPVPLGLLVALAAAVSVAYGWWILRLGQVRTAMVCGGGVGEDTVDRTGPAVTAAGVGSAR